MKLISDSYLYQIADYGKNLFDFLMSAERVNKNDEAFSDVVYAIKKQANATLMKVLMSNRIVLLIGDKGISRAFKVIYAKDFKDDKNKKKVFIDCTGIITHENGEYTCKKISVLVSYLMTAMTYVVYYNNPKAIVNNFNIQKYGAGSFVDMMLYVLGYLKVPITYADNKERMSFVLSEYFLLCVLGLDSRGDTVYNVAKNVSGIKEKKTCDYLHTLFSFTFDDGKAKFDEFLKKFAEVFLNQKEDESTPRNRSKLTVDAFAQRWMYAFGPGTFLGLECFVPFSQIITDCYGGAFINQQNTIEKVVGSKVVTSFSHELLKIGGDNA